MGELTVPSFQVAFSPEEIKYVTNATREILETGRLILGPYTEKFESAIAGMAQAEHGVAVNSGSTALEIAYKALNVKGKKVLVPTNTNFATAAAAMYAGAQVEFYDSGLYPDVADLKARLNEDTGAVTVVHIGGYISPEMGDIVEQCRRRGVPLIEDAAHAHGSSLDGKVAGSFGDVTAFSFFPTKTLTTGEGGMLTTNDASLAALARQYRDQGKHPDGITHEVRGNSWRLTEIGAALGLAQIVSIGADNQRRANIIARYQAELAGTPLIFPDIDQTARPGGYKAIAVLPDGVPRQQFKDDMARRGIQLGKEVYEKPLHRQPVFEELQHGDSYPVADRFAGRHICLPLWRFMPDADVTAVIEGLQQQLVQTQRGRALGQKVTV